MLYLVQDLSFDPVSILEAELLTLEMGSLTPKFNLKSGRHLECGSLRQNPRWPLAAILKIIAHIVWLLFGVNHRVVPLEMSNLTQ